MVGENSNSDPSPLPSVPPQPTKPAAQSKKRQRKADPKAKRNASSHESDNSSPTPHPPHTSLPPPHHIYHQPYPPPPFIMNPSQYPINGSPFTQPPPPGAYPPQASPPPPPGAQPVPGHPGYSYMAPPYHHPSAYYQYHPPVMMYGSPTSAHPDPGPQSAASPVPQSASTGGKRKRKSTGDRGRGKGGDGGSDDEPGPSGTNQQAGASASADSKKRTKTQRACDSCRSRKIRCDILSDAEPPTCHHCKQYGFECTFFLPITETRFKKKKLEDENTDKDKAEGGKSATSPKADSQGPRDIGVYATISSRIYENYDQRYHHSYEVSRDGDGLILVQKPTREEQQPIIPKPVDIRIEREIIQDLVNAYFTQIAPLMPIVTQAEFLTASSPPPILLYSICLVAAARREVPQAVFDSIRYTVNNIIRADDVLSTASIVNVQSLLILCMTGDCHSQFVPTALSALWVRLGTAIRMAQDLGLHRAESLKQDIELRRRLWGACVISDRWTSLTFGHPYMIDVQDCDARLPSSGHAGDVYMDELVRLSIVLGRVLKTIYSPTGLTLITDEMLYKILGDIEAWRENLPDSLKFRGPDTPLDAGILHLFYSCVCMIFWRVFMRISYSCPAHLKFGLTVEQWSNLVTLTGDAIDWLDAHERTYDVWLLVAYAATSCALVQYHTWARRKDTEAAAKLRKLRDCVRRWEGSLSPDHMSARRKTAEIIALLYEATQGPQFPLETPALNPTGGVKGKQPVGVLDYKKDPTRPGGGVFVAHGKARDGYTDLPPGTIVQGSSDEESEGEASGLPMSSSNLSASNNTNDLDRSFLSSLSSSSSFAPPLSDYPKANKQAGGSSSGAGAGAGSESLVNFTPLPSGGRGGGGYANVNPAMNVAQSGARNQVINILDTPHASNTLAELSMTDTGFLDGLPGGMFDWGQWDTFFSRFNSGTGDSTAGISSNPQQLGQSQQSRPPT